MESPLSVCEKRKTDGRKQLKTQFMSFVTNVGILGRAMARRFNQALSSPLQPIDLDTKPTTLRAQSIA